MQHNTPIVLNELYCAIHHVDDINRTCEIYAALKTTQCSIACMRRGRGPEEIHYVPPRGC